MRRSISTAVVALALAACSTGGSTPGPADARLDAPADTRPEASVLEVSAPDATQPDVLAADEGALDVVAPMDVAEEPAEDISVLPDESLPDLVVPADEAPAPDVSEPDVAPLPDAAPSGPVVPIAIEGFGRLTRGGWQEGYDEVVVTSLADDGPGTLREATRTENRPRVVRFGLSGNIDLAAPLLMPSNITIDGRGQDVHLRRKGIVIPGVDEVILTNFTIEDVAPTTEDGVQIGNASGEPSERIVLDHLRFAQQGDNGDSDSVDEAISVVFGSRDITVQWCHFLRWEKVMLFGNGDAAPALDEQISVTVHHNHAEATGRRHPQARYGRYDFFDNYWNDWRMYGWVFEPPFRDSFAMHCQDRCRLIAENNAFRRTNHLMDVGSRSDHGTSCASGGVVEERGSFVAPGSSASIRFGVDCPAGARAFERPYTLTTLEPANAAFVMRLVTEVGPRRP